MKKILLALQFCPLDIEMAYRLVDIICRIESETEGKSDKADIMLSVRHDTPMPLKWAKPLKEHFDKLHIFQTKNRVFGHPAGPNNQAYETLSHACKMKSLYDAVFLFEPDSIPLKKSWIDRIHAEWHSGGNHLVMGNYCYPVNYIPHINGNCLVSTSIDQKIPQYLEFMKRAGAWDVITAPLVIPTKRYKASAEILSEYAIRKQTDEQIWRPRIGREQEYHNKEHYYPSWLHGIKDDSGFNAVEKRLNDGTMPT